MKIAISAAGPDLDAEVDPRFGRCQYFVIVDPETMEFEAIENTNLMASGGAGIASAQTVADKEVQAVLTGNCGPNAYQTLDAAGIEVITGVSGKIRSAIEKYKSGQFRSTSGPTVGAHAGMGGGAGINLTMRPGMGMRRSAATGPDMGVGNQQQEIEKLKTQTEILSQQLSEVMRRLDDLEKRAK